MPLTFHRRSETSFHALTNFVYSPLPTDFSFGGHGRRNVRFAVSSPKIFLIDIQIFSQPVFLGVNQKFFKCSRRLMNKNTKISTLFQIKFFVCQQYEYFSADKLDPRLKRLLIKIYDQSRNEPIFSNVLIIFQSRDEQSFTPFCLFGLIRKFPFVNSLV